MMRKVAILLVALLVSACSPQYSEKNYPVLPPELKDCRFFKVTSGDGLYITVVRCPNSSTATSEKDGKTWRYTALVEGENQ